jgi:hypothetical protein
MTRAEMADHIRKVSWMGPYRAGVDDTEVLVIADDIYTAILCHNTIASEARGRAPSTHSAPSQKRSCPGGDELGVYEVADSMVYSLPARTVSTLVEPTHHDRRQV